LALTWGWSLNAFDLTRSRASHVEQALVRYHQEQGIYPSKLDDLTPRYLLFVPPPLVVRRVGWCYQGGEDFYRLGYVSGDFTYMNAYFKVEVFSQAGEPPQEGWSCDAIAQKFQAGNIGY